MPLTDMACRNALAGPKDRKLTDSNGLCLLVKASGFKSWRWRYSFEGREKQLVIGPYPEIRLAQARDTRDQTRALLRQGIDPSARKKDARRRKALSGLETFEGCARAWHEAKGTVLSPRYAKAVLSRLEQNVFRQLGTRSIREITPPAVLEVLRVIEKRGAKKMAQKVRQHMSEVFVWAIGSGLADQDPAAIVRNALAPANARRRPAALAIEGARAVLIKTEASRTAHWSTLLASRLVALTAARPGVVRLAERREFIGLDGTSPRWRIPAAKMKLFQEDKEDAAHDFVVPLSRQAVALVKVAIAAHPAKKTRLINAWMFPGVAGWRRPISDATLSKLYRENGFAGVHVPHGWRASFSTIMNEIAAENGSEQDRAIIELMLAHMKGDVEAAYNRAVYMPRRREIAQAWADMLMEGMPEPGTLVAHLAD